MAGYEATEWGLREGLNYEERLFTVRIWVVKAMDVRMISFCCK